MSGILKSTGAIFNPGEEQFDISSILNLKIKSLDIYSIPLSSGPLMDIQEDLGKFFNLYSIQQYLLHFVI